MAEIDNTTLLNLGKNFAAISRNQHLCILREFIKQDIDIGIGPFRIFMLIFKNPGISQKEIVRKLPTEKSSVAKMVKKLSASGYVIVEKCEEDKRLSKLHLSQKGYDLSPKIEKILINISKNSVAGLSEMEINHLLALLNKVDNNFKNLI